MKPFKLIYADPAWHFAVRSPKGEGRSAKNHYQVMSLEDIKNLPIPGISDDNSVLLMWAIDPMLDQAFEVIKAWGFTYKTVGFYWVKENMRSPGYFMGTGYYTRANPEICLLATRGAGLPRIDRGVRKLIVSPRGRHSEKPNETRIRIKQLFGNVRRVELFARERFPGWHVFGNEVEGSIKL